MSGPAKHYTHQPAAQAFFTFRQEGEIRSLRITCLSISREFTDGSCLGHDPEGILFYNNISDISGSCNYKVQRKIDDSGSVYAHVFFYHGNSIDDAFAEFVGRDPAEAVNAARMDEYKSSGPWWERSVTQTPAMITRQPGSNTITMVFDPDSSSSGFTKATFPLGNDLTLSLNSLDGARGKFTYRNDGNFVNPNKLLKCAFWTKDRIVFTPNSRFSVDWEGHFMPNEGVDIGNLVPTNGAIRNIKWS